MIAKPCTDATSNDDNSGCIEHISQSGQGRKHSTEQEHQKSKQCRGVSGVLSLQIKGKCCRTGQYYSQEEHKNKQRYFHLPHGSGENKAAATNKLIIPNPIEPTRNASVASWNNETVRLPSIMAIALAPKHRLYASGDMLKCS